MKSAKKDSRIRVPGRFLEAAENIKDRKRAKIPEQPTPPIQEEPEPISKVLQGDDILALAIKKEDLQKQHVPRLTEDSPAIIQKFFIRKLKPKDSRRKIRHLVAHPAKPEAAAKPLDYSGRTGLPRKAAPFGSLYSLTSSSSFSVPLSPPGPGDSFNGPDQILPHHILGTLQDFKRIAVARGNTQLAELIRVPPCLVTLISAGEEPTPKAPKREKRLPRAPPPQHNFLKHWQRHVALQKKQQEALSKHLKKPVSQLLMHSGETYRRIQEERELIDRFLPTGHDGKDYKETSAFWSPLEYLGGEKTGLVITKTKTQRGLAEPVACIRKPRSIQAEMGLSAPEDTWHHRAWDRSLFLIYRRRELQSLMAELDFSQRGIDCLEVVGRGQPFSSVTVEDSAVFEKSQESVSEDTACQDFWAGPGDAALMPILGPSLLFCGKPACWIRGRNSQDKSQVGIGVRLTFETLEGQKTSSELTVVNNGTVAIGYDWRRRPQLDSFQDLKRIRTQQFYFNNREGVILPGETKTFTFFFKSLNAGIFRESWEFRTHPTLLGGALLLVTLQAVSLTQDIFRDERKLLESKLAAHESVTIVHSVLQELLRGILTPERTPSPVDAYVTEEDLFHHRNPGLHYQHQAVQSLHQLWHQYMILPLKDREPRLSQEEPLSSRIQAVSVEKVPANPEHFKNPVSELQLPRPESKTLRDPREPLPSQKSAAGAKNSPRKSIMEEILVEENPDLESSRSRSEPDGLSLSEWNLCLGDFRKAVMALPEGHEKEDALIRLNRAVLELCPEQRPLPPDLLYQLCLQLWRDVIDSLVSHSLWLRMVLGLPEKETIYVFAPEEQDQKSLPTMEMKVTAGRVGKEERKGAPQEKRPGGIRDKEDKKGTKTPVKEERVNSKKQKAKEDKKVVKSTSHDRLSSEDPTPDGTTASQEPTDPLVMEKYMQRLYTEVYGLLDTLVTNLMVLADQLSPGGDVEEQLHV
ncbi:MYCBP-associated protein isoform X3 [Fukomys damarensis]|uniref:MYCBP-associated protein isoform X3 n=1 Tax=Fukomys damarensis TaxID=885580 RepID=UPI0014553571|nr:MYCBP-associated protein isoform X3 [Fukomys damarensis]